MEFERKLSEEEIDAIAEKVTQKMTENLYGNVGKGVVGLAIKGIILIIIGLAAYGYIHKMNPF